MNRAHTIIYEFQKFLLLKMSDEQKNGNGTLANVDSKPVENAPMDESKKKFVFKRILNKNTYFKEH